MGTTNILDLNNRVDELEKSYPANKVVMTGGGNVEDAVDSIEDTIKEGPFPLTVDSNYAALIYNKSRYINAKTVHLSFMIEKKDAWTTDLKVVIWDGNCNENGTASLAYGTSSGQWDVMNTIMYMYIGTNGLFIRPTTRYIIVDTIITF